MNDSLPGIILACTLRGTLLIAVAVVAGPGARRLFGPNGAHWLWLAVLPVLLWPVPPRTPWSLRAVWSAPAVASAAAQQPVEDVPAGGEADTGPLLVKIRKEEVAPRQIRWLPSGEGAQTAEPMPSTAPGPASGSRWLGVVWAVGAIFGLGSLAWRWRRTLRLLRGTRPVTDARVLAVLARHVSLGRIGLAVTSSVRAPALAGLWRPRILLPEGWLEELSESELESVLLHELGHHRRADLLWEWLYAIARCLHWMNPAVWLAERLARQEREIACDGWALTRSKSPEDYGGALLEALKRMQRGSSHRDPAPMLTSVGVAAMAEDARQMARRLRWIARGSSAPRWLAALGWMPGLAALAVIGTDPLAAQTQPPAKASASPAPASEGADTATRAKTAPAPVEAPLPLAKRTVGARTRILRVPETLAKKLGWPIAEEKSKGVEKLLSAEEFRGIIATLQATPEAELLPGPRLTARSGQEARFEAVREFRFGDHYKAAPSGIQVPGSTETINLGLYVAWRPQIKDETTVQLDFTAELTRLLGFGDEDGNLLTKIPAPPPGRNWTQRLVTYEMPAGIAGQPTISRQEAVVHFPMNPAQVALLFGFRDVDRSPAPGATGEQTMVNYFALQIDIAP